MDYVRWGELRLQVSRIRLGCLTFDNEREYMIEQDDAKLVVDEALDLDINVFNPANSHSHGRSEEIS